MDTNSAPTATGASQTNVAPASASPATQGTANSQTGSITPEAFAALQRQVTQQSALIRRLSEGKVKPAAGTQANAGQPAPSKTSDDQATLTAMRAEILALKEKNEHSARLAEQKQRNAEIKSAIAAHGIDSENAIYLEDHILQRHANRIVIDGDNVLYESAMGERLTIKDFIATLPNLDRFRPVVQTPSARGSRPSANATQGPRVPFSELPEETRKAMTPEERRAYVKAELNLK